MKYLFFLIGIFFDLFLMHNHWKQFATKYLGLVFLVEVKIDKD